MEDEDGRADGCLLLVARRPRKEGMLVRAFQSISLHASS